MMLLDDRTNIIGHLSEWLCRPRELVLQDLTALGETRKPLADLWTELSPKTPEDFNQFYQDKQGRYIPDLVNFNTRPEYWARINLALKVSGRVVDFGGGIGTLSIALRSQGCQPIYVELPSPQRDFAEWRFKKLGGPWNVADSLAYCPGPVDHIDAVDVMEHLHPKVLPEIIAHFARLVRKGGTVNTINDFGTQLDVPQHQNTELEFNDLMRQNGFLGGSVRWLKN